MRLARPGPTRHRPWSSAEALDARSRTRPHPRAAFTAGTFEPRDESFWLLARGDRRRGGGRASPCLARLARSCLRVLRWRDHPGRGMIVAQYEPPAGVSVLESPPTSSVRPDEGRDGDDPRSGPSPAQLRIVETGQEEVRGRVRRRRAPGRRRRRSPWSRRCSADAGAASAATSRRDTRARQARIAALERCTRKHGRAAGSPAQARPRAARAARLRRDRRRRRSPSCARHLRARPADGRRLAVRDVRRRERGRVGDAPRGRRGAAAHRAGPRRPRPPRGAPRVHPPRRGRPAAGAAEPERGPARGAAGARRSQGRSRMPRRADRRPAPLDAATVLKLNERLLPYAVLFGLEREWSEELAALYAARRRDAHVVLRSRRLQRGRVLGGRDSFTSASSASWSGSARARRRAARAAAGRRAAEAAEAAAAGSDRRGVGV